MSATPVPQAIHREDDSVTITWEKGHVGVYPARALRLACPCAECVEEMTGRALLDPRTVPEHVAPAKIDLVGAYAIKITWSDGHDTGLYTYETLLALCPCDQCGRAQSQG